MECSFPVWNRDRVVRLLETCGRTALDWYGRAGSSFKADASIVTEADRRIEKLLTDELENESENIRFVGEETFEKRSGAYLDAALSSGQTWIVDPVDGTADYAKRIPFWGHSIGFAVDGVIREGGIFLPCTGEMLISNAGKTYYAQSDPSPEHWDFVHTLRELAPPDPRFDASSVVAVSQRTVRNAVITLRQTLLSFGSCVYPAVLMATGRVSAAVNRAKLWDHAGYLASLKNLGFSSPLPDTPDLMSGRIDPAIYRLDYAAKGAFALTGGTVIARTPEIAREVQTNCRPV